MRGENQTAGSQDFRWQVEVHALKWPTFPKKLVSAQLQVVQELTADAQDSVVAQLQVVQKLTVAAQDFVVVQLLIVVALDFLIAGC